jgi:hypothetical protein
MEIGNLTCDLGFVSTLSQVVWGRASAGIVLRPGPPIRGQHETERDRRRA